MADTFFQGPNAAVDVVFVVDDSNSMANIQASLAAAAPAFFDSLNALGTDYQVGVVTTDMNDPDRRGRLFGAIIPAGAANGAAAFGVASQPGIAGSQLERGLAAAWSAITPPLSTHENEGLRREGARLAAIIVTDEDDCSDEGALPTTDPAACVSFPQSLVSIAEYASRFRSLVDQHADVSVHAIVETGTVADEVGCGGLNVGTRYVQLARRLGGLVVPHCDDMNAVMSELALQVAGRRSAFPLSRTPDPLTISVTVAVDAQPLGDDDDSGVSGGNELGQDEQLVGTTLPEDITRTNGWTYDEDSNTVRIWGEGLPGIGGAVQIRYQVATSG